jgi:hypothetical protein
MTRATILLIPLFGVQFLLTLVRPNTQDCDLEQLYYYFFYTMDGLQGIFVALFYCYLNKEVRIISAKDVYIHNKPTNHTASFQVPGFERKSE